jgi:two-component SAPR family response regulator
LNYTEIRKSDEKVKICFITAYEIDNNDFARSFPTMTLQHFIKPISLDKLANELKEIINEDYQG